MGVPLVASYGRVSVLAPCNHRGLSAKDMEAMKFQVKFTANGEEISAVDRAVLKQLKAIGCNPPCAEECPACKMAEDSASKLLSLGSKFIQFGKQITIEFDTETGTATVVPV